MPWFAETWNNDFNIHDDFIKWKHFACYWPFVRGIHRSLVYCPHKGRWRGALMFCLICTWTNGWVSSRDASDLRGHRMHYGVTVMCRANDLMRTFIPCKWFQMNTAHDLLRFSTNHFDWYNAWFTGITAVPLQWFFGFIHCTIGWEFLFYCDIFRFGGF